MFPMDHVMCYKGTVLQQKKSMSFFYNSFVKFHGKKIWEPRDHILSKSVL